MELVTCSFFKHVVHNSLQIMHKSQTVLEDINFNNPYKEADSLSENHRRKKSFKGTQIDRTKVASMKRSDSGAFES